MLSAALSPIHLLRSSILEVAVGDVANLSANGLGRPRGRDFKGVEDQQLIRISMKVSKAESSVRLSFLLFTPIVHPFTLRLPGQLAQPPSFLQSSIFSRPSVFPSLCAFFSVPSWRRG